MGVVRPRRAGLDSADTPRGIAVSAPSADATALPPHDRPAATGGLRGVLEAAAACRHRAGAALALVVETEGSTYVRAGAVALFEGGSRRAGWLSGGCLEPEIARHAGAAAGAGQLRWLELDTRDDADLLSGSAVGCRGRLRIALLPLAALPGWDALVAAWRGGRAPLAIELDGAGSLACAAGAVARRWPLPVEVPGAGAWSLALPAPPSALVFGAGPETPALLPLLRGLGWMTTLVEPRPRWAALGAHADATLAGPPAHALERPDTQRCDAALVMHHHFELDRDALAALAPTSIPFVGLLGPIRRRDDLFRVLPPAARDALVARLHAPVGLDLGGHGPEAIALSIAAQLHARHHAR